jgi:hypothetical protein
VAVLTQKCCYDYDFADQLYKNVVTSEKYELENYPLAIFLNVDNINETIETEERVPEPKDPQVEAKKEIKAKK